MTPAQFIQQLELEHGVTLFIENGRLKMAGNPRTLEIVHPLVLDRADEVKRALIHARTISSRLIGRVKRGVAQGRIRTTLSGPVSMSKNNLSHNESGKLHQRQGRVEKQG
jgi:hypothetical protein